MSAYMRCTGNMVAVVKDGKIAYGAARYQKGGSWVTFGPIPRQKYKYEEEVRELMRYRIEHEEARA